MKTEASQFASQNSKMETMPTRISTVREVGELAFLDRLTRTLVVEGPLPRLARIRSEKDILHGSTGNAIPQFSDDEIRAGFKAREFELFFQPQVELLTGSVTGAEVLLRWRHSRRGLLAPDAFLRSLEDSSIVGDMGRWIIDEACRVGAIANTGGRGIRIGVNLFSEQLYDQGLHSHIAQALELRGLSADMLELEITETTVLHRDSAVIAQLGRIRSMGVGIAFDDYGTGFASLSLLKSYPLTRLKIDREFVMAIDRDPNDVAIVDAVVTLAAKLNLEVIAEGMENQAQVDELIRLGCTQGQGYLFAKPMPAKQFEELVLGRARLGHRLNGPDFQPYTKV